MTTPSPAQDTTPRRTGGRSALLVGAGVMLSRVSGLVREVVLAGLLGTRLAADAFRAALQIPGMLQNLLGEGVLSASFIPVYSQLVESEDQEESDRLAGAVAGLLGLFTAFIVLVGVLLARPITKILLPFVGDEAFDLTVSLVRIMWAGLGFIVLAALCLGILNTHRRFFLSYVAPVLWNGAQVVLMLIAWASDWSDADIARAAAWGVVIGGGLQFLVQVPRVLSILGRLRISLDRSRPAVREVLRRFVPAVSGRGVVQLSALLDLFLAGLLAAGAIAAVGLAQVLYLLPIGVFAMSVAAADLPELSREQNNQRALLARIKTGMERVTFYVLFSAIAFITMGKLLVGALFERGSFTPDDTVLIWLVLAAYSMGLMASAQSRLLQNVCFAAGDVSGPAKIAGLRVALAALVGLILMLQFDRLAVISGAVEKLEALPSLSLLPESIRQDEDLPQRMGALGLALGSAGAAWVEYFILRERARLHLGGASLGAPTLPLLPAAAVSAVLGGWLAYLLDGVPAIIGALIAMAIAGSAYVLLAAAQDSPSATDLLRATGLKKRRS